VEDDTIQDLAADFVEQELGRFDFVNNWKSFVGKAVTRGIDPLRYIQLWIISVGDNENKAKAVYDYLDCMSKENKKWIG